MATLDDIKILLESIKDEIPALMRNARIGANQVTIVSGLSEMSEQLGLVQAGEFRTGNGKEPGFGFSGGRFGWPGFEYDGDTYFLAGIENDIIQIGMRIEDGTLVFGIGTGVLDEGGIELLAAGASDDSRGYKFVSDSGNILGGLYQYYSDSAGWNILRMRNVFNPIYLDAQVYVDSRGANSATAYLTADASDYAGDVGIFSVTQDATQNASRVETSGLSAIELGVVLTTPTNLNRVIIHEDPGNANVLMMDMTLPSGGSKFAIGGDVVLWGGRNGVSTVFNGNGFNIDFNVQGQTDLNLMYVDASQEAVGFGAVPASANFKVFVTGGIFTDGARSRGATLTDDTAVSDTPARPNGILIMGTNGDATTWGLVYYNTVTPQTIALNVGSNLNVSTGALAGTTGVDTKMTVSAHTDGKIYFENRRGGSRAVYALYI